MKAEELAVSRRDSWRKIAISLIDRVVSLTWACGPPMGMKNALLRFSDSK